jgi:hypothetical protein
MIAGATATNVSQVSFPSYESRAGFLILRAIKTAIGNLKSTI